jgi:hypothetical protein
MSVTPPPPDTRERFLLGVAEQVAADRIVEVHVFPGITQGGIESGVAVIAAHRTDVVPGSRERYTVFTANYRLARKGPERGKWELSVVEEADAPLLTVESVVRGVQRRSGDVGEPERIDGDAVRALVATHHVPS